MLLKNILSGLWCLLAVSAWAQHTPRLRNFQPGDYEAQNLLQLGADSVEETHTQVWSIDDWLVASPSGFNSGR